MILKLSLTGLKGRLRDYLVLFSGVVITSAIFYMFQSIATNQEFLQSNTTIDSIMIIFHLGTVLLSIITFVYILYANTFLMSLRQKDYAMFMMLGAKGRRIAQLIFIETLIIGIAATLVGLLIGIALTAVISQLLVEQLHLAITHFSAFNMSALLFTAIFFMLLFLLASLFNAFSIVKKPILQLLKETATPVRLKRRSAFLIIEALLGIVLLAVGYFMLKEISTYKILGLGIALFVVIGGTYAMFHSTIIAALQLLKKNAHFSMKRLNNFTLSQLGFRMREYTQILSMVTILFALALGAITVGLGFSNEIISNTNRIVAYDAVVNNAQLADQQQLDSENASTISQYHLKENDTQIYLNRSEFDAAPFVMNKNSDIQTMNGTDLVNNNDALQEFADYLLPSQTGKKLILLTDTEYNQVELESTQINLYRFADFSKHLSDLKRLTLLNQKINPSLADAGIQNGLNEKYDIYQMMNSLYSGLEFMGFFLGIAFLTMLASCLMFKILTGANNDRLRYEMLRKIGTRRKVMRQSIYREVGILFLIPGVLGVVHVLFGMQMFSDFLSNPYQGIWIPFTIFLVSYLSYYLLTVSLYTGIVLPKEPQRGNN
ncbi:FtsX-like permease family protein [Erwinia sp. CPCC 100877]|nr:FtsX-like permease family protein [Erwinia sp. CPCC 100877]